MKTLIKDGGCLSLNHNIHLVFMSLLNYNLYFAGIFDFT